MSLVLLELSTTEEEEEVAVSSSGGASGMRGRLPLLGCLLSTTTPAERRGRRVEAAGAVCGREEEEAETRGRTDSGCGASGVKEVSCGVDEEEDRAGCIVSGEAGRAW